jgi:hypothetical protein
MTTERELDEILAEIGREHRATSAPERLESMLFAAVDSRRGAAAKPRMRLAWAWAAAVMLLAGVATAGLIWHPRRSHPSQDQQARSVRLPQARPEPAAASPQAGKRQRIQSNPAQIREAGKARASLRDSTPKRATSNSLDEFVPLPVSEGLPTAAELSVVRIRLRGSDLQQYGLETPADAVAHTVLAEFAVGEDGLPRAIRIVR